MPYPRRLTPLVLTFSFPTHITNVGHSINFIRDINSVIVLTSLHFIELKMADSKSGIGAQSRSRTMLGEYDDTLSF